MQPNTRSAYLIIRQGNRWADVFRLENGQSLIVGRASSNEIPVSDERASRRHAEVFCQGDDWFVRDLGSRNGTLLNGVKIDTACLLVPGAQIVVASCWMTFVRSLEDYIPPPNTSDEASPQSHTQTDIPPAITHRKDRTSLLESREIEPSEVEGLAEKPSVEPQSAPTLRDTLTDSDRPRPGSPVAMDLLQLAFDLAQQTNVNDACELALKQLLQTVACQAGGVLRLEDTKRAPSSAQPTEVNVVVMAAHERAGRAYHPVSETIIAAVRRDPAGILARNVARDAELLGSKPSDASHVLTTTSMMVAPIRIEGTLYGLIHLYARAADPELTPADLEVALAIAEVLAVSLKNLMRQQTLENKLQSTADRLKQLEQQLGHGEWIGGAEGMRQLREQVQRVAPTHATILIRGESGTGKELVARAIHDRSGRSSGPFIAINCAALTPTLLESELFGHEKGAFTGATERKLGKFELANGGTLMLDELGEMSMEIQAKFLRVLEGQVFERVGGSKPIRVDVRVIAATNRDLEQAVKDGEFRSDLYFRLRVIELRIPPLRNRLEDIVPLAEFFLKQNRARSGHGPIGFSPIAQQAMRDYHWPGNVRELKNCVERAHVLALGPLAEPEDLALSHLQVPGIHAETIPTVAVYQEKTLEQIELDHIEATMRHTGGQKNRAASILGIERSTLDRKLKRLGDTGN
jgi:Nif-specific regulatory protein